MAKSRF